MRIRAFGKLVLCVAAAGAAVAAGQAQDRNQHALRALESSLSRAQSFFVARGDSFDSQYLLIILDYIGRAYSFDPKASKAALSRPPVYHDERQDVALYRRLLDPAGTVLDREAFKRTRGIGRLMAWSIWSDKVRPDPIYAEIMRQSSTKEDRDLTHAALALAWLGESGGTKYLPEADSMRSGQIQLLLDLARRENYATDTGMEALAGLARLGRPDLISDEAVSGIMSAQRFDGGWGWKPEDKNTHDHPTVLAVWVLLAYRDRDRPVVRWLRIGE